MPCVCHLIAFGLLLSFCFVRSAAWTYGGDEGPNDWPDLFPACGAKQQSPININPDSTSCRLYPPFVFQHYDNVHMASFLENGHTAVLSLLADVPLDRRPIVSGGGLDSDYVFQQLHFHWGRSDDVGSEHFVDDDPYSGELHLVHYNAKYGTYNNALKHPDGLAVLAVFLEVTQSSTHNREIEPIIQHLRDVTHADQSVVIPETLNFRNLLPFSTRKFYRYHGSLTTPPCSEIVTWTVFQDPILLTKDQMALFRKLTNDEGRPLVNNDRPIQPRHGRIVFASFDILFPNCFPGLDF